MAQCLIHKEAMTAADALTLKLKVSEERKQLLYYMPKCVHLNYSALVVDEWQAKKACSVKKLCCLVRVHVKQC